MGTETNHLIIPDILTQEEKTIAIAHAIHQHKLHYVRRKTSLGIPVEKIERNMESILWEGEVDLVEVLKGANQRKHWKVEEMESYRKRLQEENDRLEALRKKCDANYFYNLISNYFKTNYGKFDFNESNRDCVKTICYFFANDERFETELGLSFNKGLLIMGRTGLGKTKTIEAICDNLIAPISIFSMIDISERVRDSGDVQLNTSKIILLDDVGSEQEAVKHYGTPINWFKDFIEVYYLNHKSFRKLIITTNCGGDELERKYGSRVRSRIREMFNIIQVLGNDKR